MKKLIITVLSILFLAAGTIEARIDPGHHGKKRAQHERREIRRDRAKMKHNLKQGNYRAAHRNHRDLKQDKRQLRHARHARHAHGHR